MHRPLSVLCALALGVTGVALSAPATAAPAPQASSTAAAAVADELIIGYNAGATTTDRAKARDRVSARLAERVVAAATDRTEVERVLLPSGRDRGQAIAALQSDPAVAYAEPNWIYTKDGKPTGGSTTVSPTFGSAAKDIVSDSAYASGELWGMLGSGTLPKNNFGANAGPVWASGATGSKDVVIGVIDEGIQFDHPELNGVVGNQFEKANDRVDNDGNGKTDDSYGWDFVSDDNTVFDGTAGTDVDAHGTHVSGTIGALPNGGRIVGVNQQVTIISGKFLGTSGGSLADAVQAVDYFTDLKANRGLNVVATSNSWGGGGYSQALLDAIKRAAATDILFVAAAGNSGTNNDRRASYPSNYSVPLPGGGDAVIAVAAIDKLGALASFSQYGATTVDLGAPGVGILSSVPVNGYATYSGTSMATPHVSGAIALYEATNPGATGTAVRAAIMRKVVPTASLAGKTASGGRLDTAGAVLNK